MQIEIEKLSKSYDGRAKAIDGLSVRINPGITALVGENGAGKSTLLRLIAGVIDPDEGEVILGDGPSKEKKTSVFFLPDDPFGPVGSTIRSMRRLYDNFYFFDESAFNSCIAHFSLPLDKRLTSFSKGMRRQAYLSLALSCSAPILLLVEAFDGLDPLSLSFIKDRLIDLDPGKIVLIASHNTEAIKSIAERFLLLYKGKLGEDKGTGDLGKNLVKYQAIFSGMVKKEGLEAYGLDVIMFNKLGSITSFVAVEDEAALEKMKAGLHPSLCEAVAMSESEALSAELSLAKKKGGNENE